MQLDMTLSRNIAFIMETLGFFLISLNFNIPLVLYFIFFLYYRFDEDLEAIYAELFAPLSITRHQFKKLCSSKVLSEMPKVLSLHSGECYAIQNLTRTDRLALCIHGRINVLTDRTFLHSIHPGEFLDSPEFESSGVTYIFGSMKKKNSKAFPILL